MAQLVFATSKNLHEPESEKILRNQLTSLGHQVKLFPWNGDQTPFFEAELVILRTCWDYYKQPKLFKDWLLNLQQHRIRVLNPIEMVLWNFEKTYLIELQEAGFLVPETYIVDAYDLPKIEQKMAQLNWEQAVLKPVSGQSGHYLQLLKRREACTWSTSQAPQKEALLQAFEPKITSLGETLLIFIAGEFSHAIRRVLPKGEWKSNSQYGSSLKISTVNPKIIEQAHLILQYVSQKFSSTMPLYVRIDGIIAEGDLFSLMEVELIEPNLGFQLAPSGALSFAKSVDHFLSEQEWESKN